MKVAPEVALEPAVAECKIQKLHSGSEYKHPFKFRGRTFSLFKVVQLPDAPFYARVMVQGRSVKFCLKTNVRADAEKRAKLRIGQILDEEWRPAPAPAPAAAQGVSTLADVFRVYPSIALISPEIIRNNQTMMRRITTVALGKTDPASVRLDELTEQLAEAFERALVVSYEAKASGPADKREARLRALRTAKSVHNQAKSIFNSKKRFARKYEERGLVIPDCVRGFCSASLSGRLNKASFSPPDETVIRNTFDRLPELEAADPQAHLLFWLMVGTGMRRSECAEFKAEDLHESDGALWVSGGIGKDGKVIQVRVQTKAAPHLRPCLGQRGLVLGGDHRMRHDTIPARLNAWLNSLGWHDQKKGHALRAYIGGKIFERNPRAAQVYLRHKSITTTEAFYSHFASMNKGDVDVL